VPVTILSGEKRGFYIHCNVNHDNALFYQTYNSFGEVTAQDKHVAIFPGQARCGSHPFTGRGRWRKVRGLSGSVTYRPIKKNLDSENTLRFSSFSPEDCCTFDDDVEP